MGKIIEFKSEHDLDIGTVLWVVGEKDVRKYKPCPACENQRTIKVTDSKSNEYDMPCPRCTGQQTKGLAWREFKHYRAVAYRICGFWLSSTSQKMNLCQCDEDSDCCVYPLDITNSESLIATESWGDGKTQFYISEQEAAAEAKRLNAEQAALIKAFLEQ